METITVEGEMGYGEKMVSYLNIILDFSSLWFVIL